MNILPKKRWHVRTKENIARVRRDEKKAAEDEKERIRKIHLAEQEARLTLLRTQSSKRNGRDLIHEAESEKGNSSDLSKHINFFEDIEAGFVGFNKPNEEYQKEKKGEQEKYEKQIGYLTYLGQDTNEITGKVSWYNKVPERFKSDDQVEVKANSKKVIDPLNIVNFYLGMKEKSVKDSKSVDLKKDFQTKLLDKKIFEVEAETSKTPLKDKVQKKEKKHSREKKKKKSKSKKHKKSYDSCSSDDGERRIKDKKLAELREKRLKRELNERLRAAEYIDKKSGKIPEVKAKLPEARYNSQFNPQLARQNYH